MSLQRKLSVAVFSISTTLLAGCPGVFNIPPTNLPPIANAGPLGQQVCVGNNVTLSGLASTDPDGDSLFYDWVQTKGPASAELDNANVATPSFAPPIAGLYEFSLTVIDGRGGSDEDTTRVVAVPCLEGDPCEEIECPPNLVCNTGTGECGPICVTDAECMDNDACTSDVCAGGACHHVELDCDDGDDCTADQCADGACQHDLIADCCGDDSCDGGETCDNCPQDCGACPDCGNDNGSDADCDDGVFCNGTEVCIGGSCVAGSDPCPGQLCRESDDVCVDCLDDGVCDDGNPCTDDSCDNGTCQYTNNNDPCDDGDPDTCNDTCSGGVCFGSDCPPECGNDFCDPGEDPCNCEQDCPGCCTDSDCDDDNLCTTDECIEGACATTSVVCPTGEACNPSTGQCEPNGGPCADDSDCDDGLFCNGVEFCLNSECQSCTSPCAEGQTCDEQIDECLPPGGPDDTIYSAETVSDSIDPAGDTDPYTFTANQDDTVVIQMSSAWTASCASGDDPCIDLITPSGGPPERTVCNAGCEEYVLMRHQLPESGQYTIVVRDGAGDDTGEYSLSLLIIPGPTVSSQDRDGGSVCAGQTRSGTISPEADTDAYTFNAEQNNTVVIQMSSAWSAVCAAGRDSCIDLIAPSGGPPEATVCNEACEENALLLGHQLLESGRYTIVVRDGHGNDTGEYSLSLVVSP